VSTTTFSLLVRTGHPDFLDLPWERALREWDSDRLVDVARGIHRHVVRFVDYEGRVYALKELPDPVAEREYRLLRRLAEENLPVVEAAGTVTGRRSPTGEPLEGVLVTRHLSFSLPYRYLFVGRTVPDVQAKLLDALALLLVRVHLEGFFWGDCSLSNALFRRDAGALYAYLVDAETGEFQPRLSDGQRQHDLEIATANVAGDLLDLVAAGRLPADTDPPRWPTTSAGATRACGTTSPARRCSPATSATWSTPACAGSTSWASTSRSSSWWRPTAATASGSSRAWWRRATTAAACASSPASPCRRTRPAGC
jgi:hypothetical protein